MYFFTSVLYDSKQFKNYGTIASVRVFKIQLRSVTIRHRLTTDRPSYAPAKKKTNDKTHSQRRHGGAVFQ